MPQVTHHSFLNDFQCTGPACEDNCCNSWTVLADEPTLALWKKEAPELLDFIEKQEPHGSVLAFDKETRICPKLSGGSCTIHATRGEKFLTDTCSLYPRITRRLGDATLMTATISCPQVARLILFSKETPFAWEPGEAVRIPTNIKHYLPDAMAEEAALHLHQHFMTIEEGNTPERHLLKIAAFVDWFDAIPLSNWPDKVTEKWHRVVRVISNPISDAHDPFFLMILMATLVSVSKIPASTRLKSVMAKMEQALSCEVMWDQASVNTSAKSFAQFDALKQHWSTHHAAVMQPVMHRLVQAMLAANLYPFAGLGESHQERVVWIAVQVATMKLALMASAFEKTEPLTEQQIVDAVQPVARVLEHLSDLKMAMPMVTEAGWLELNRLSGLLG